MSRFMKLWAMLLAAFLLVTSVGFGSSASAQQVEYASTSNAAPMFAAESSDLPPGCHDATPDEAYPSIEPCVEDACGVDNDRFYVPDNAGRPSNTYYVVGNEQRYGGQFYSSKGALSLRADVRDPAYRMIAGPWELRFTNTPCRAEAQNKIDVRLDQCQDLGGAEDNWTLTFTLFNVKDTTGLPIEDIVEVRVDSTDGVRTSTMDVGYSDPYIADGESFSFRKDVDVSGSGGELRPGRFVIKVKRSAHDPITKRFDVPYCDGTMPGEATDASVNAPRGKLTKLSGNRGMKVFADNRKVGRSTSYRLMVDPKRGTTRSVSFTLKPKSTLTASCLRGRPSGRSVASRKVAKACIFERGTVYTLRVRAKSGSHWKNVARRTY